MCIFLHPGCRLSLHTIGDTWTKAILAGKVSLSTFVEANTSGALVELADGGMVGEAVAGCTHRHGRSNVSYLVEIHPTEVAVPFLFLCVVMPYLWLS